MNFLRTQTLMRVTDSLKLRINGEPWSTQSNLNLATGNGLTIEQAESKDLSTVTLALSGNLGHYGSYWSTETQTAASTTSSYVVTLNQIDGHDGVTLEGNTRVRVANPGVYNYSTSVQVSNSSPQAYDATFWLRKNGEDITQSASVVTVTGTHGGQNGHYLFYVDLIIAMEAGDYVELVWSAGSTSLMLETIPAGLNPTRPLSPSVIVSFTQVNLSSGGAGNSGPATGGFDYGTFSSSVDFTNDMGSF